ncbi:MAG: oligomeric, coiled-coil, peripheral membrane protein, partial [Watsoniomyces obsoletus]
MNQLVEKLALAESKFSALTETSEYERTKLRAAKSELADCQSELSNLRIKLTAGETGSDALRERLSEEESKVAKLHELQYEHESTIQSLKNDIETRTKDSESSARRLENLIEKLNRRGDKAKELSQRLYQHNDRIIRMLEQFGYSISRQDDALTIQRASKVTASTILSGLESSTAMKRTVSG